MVSLVLVNQYWTGSLMKRFIVLSPPQLCVSPTSSAKKSNNALMILVCSVFSHQDLYQVTQPLTGNSPCSMTTMLIAARNDFCNNDVFSKMLNLTNADANHLPAVAFLMVLCNLDSSGQSRIYNNLQKVVRIVI